MPQLRSYKNYNNTAPYQPFVGPVFLSNLDGYASAAGWLQVFDKATTPVNGDVPLKSVNVAQAGPLPSFLYATGSITILNGLWLAFSSSDVTYTAAANPFDVWGEVDEFAGYSTVVNQNGLLAASNAVTTELTVWLSADGPKKLFRVTVNNDGATDLYAMLYATDGATNGSSPITQWLVPANDDIDLNFGPTGYSPISKSGTTIAKGCLIAMSTTPGVRTEPVSGESDIAAYYI